MPPQSRAQRRRQQQRPRPRPTREAHAADAPVLDTALPNSVELPDTPITTEVMSASMTAASPARTPRSGRRGVVRTPEPVDYTADYAAARRDLIRIFIISGLILVVMIGLYVAGVF